MSKMVSARIPDAVFEQASIQLNSIGASTTDLVNAAFEYLLEKHALPKVSASSKNILDRKLSESKRAELNKAFKECVLGVDIPNEVEYDKMLVRHERAAKYMDSWKADQA